MAKGLSSRVRIAALILALVSAVIAGVPARAQYAETPADALARNIKLLAASPRQFDALIGAGRAALALGDTQSAAGFFGRAEEVWATSPLPQAGMGAALAQDGDPRGALQYFARAVQRGATQSMIGADRGLAFDLLGQHPQAQTDYRAALVGRDVDEARRRLALSLAISGNKAEALATLAPLLARRDPGAARCRAFVLALTGDPAGAKAALDARMPGSSSSMAYFFHRLPSLRSDQKAAAVNLGIFPDAATQYASAASPVIALPQASRALPQVSRAQPQSSRAQPQSSRAQPQASRAQPQASRAQPQSSRAQPQASSALPQASSGTELDRIGSIERWLTQAPPQAGAAAPTDWATVAPRPRPQPQPTQVASASLPTRLTSQVGTSSDVAAAPAKPRVWLQLASGPNAAALPGQFKRLRSRDREMFEGISPYVAEDGHKARLLIGPFRNSREAEIFAEGLDSISVDAFEWMSKPGQPVRKLPAE
jgi:tetratricopeptide (TPR) repeat protein